jgi:hypothetical protein
VFIGNPRSQFAGCANDENLAIAAVRTEAQKDLSREEAEIRQQLRSVGFAIERSAIVNQDVN